jgi:hypothetical protein
MGRMTVFYKTDVAVQRGDEYYQVVSRTADDPNSEHPFRVAVYHGRAGTPSKMPESEAEFKTADEAEAKFNEFVSEILAKGFQHYSMPIHGVHDFE